MQKKYLTEYQLRSDSPDSEPCKKAGKKLYKEISDRIGRTELTGIGIGLNSPSTGPAIRVYLLSEEHVKSIPPTYLGYEVITTVIGEDRVQVAIDEK